MLIFLTLFVLYHKFFGPTDRIFYIGNIKENLSSVPTMGKTSQATPIISTVSDQIVSPNPTDPTKDTKTYTKQIDILQDSSFSDIIFYRSAPIYGEITGLIKCMDNCNGICAEFGINGDAMCYPKQN